MNLPNALTLARIALVAPMILLLAGDHALAAACVFAVGMFTDALDGHIARSRGLVTDFGKLADPLADKLLVGGALICLAAISRVALWVVVVVLARELAVTALRALAGRRGTVIAASSLGKAKTGLQVIAILALIVAADPGAAWVDALVYAAVTATVASGVAYFTAFLPASRQPAIATSGS